MYDKISEEHQNILCNILYRSLQRRTVKELEEGLQSQGWTERDVLQLQFEPIDFSAHIREGIDYLYYYYFKLGSSKYVMLRDITTETVQIRKVQPGQVAKEGNLILEVSDNQGLYPSPTRILQQSALR